MGWVNETAAEIDRVVVAVFEQVGRELSEEFEFPNAHPGFLLGVGYPLLQGPIAVEDLAAMYPYLPSELFEKLVQNNADEGAISLHAGVVALTDRGRETATRLRERFDEISGSLWEGHAVSDLESSALVALAHARSLGPLVEPSAFAIQGAASGPSSAARLFHALTALRYWRADAHRAAWSAAGLSVLEAHTLNRLWDLDRGVERVGQGEPRPGRRGVAGLTERGYAENEVITELGRKAREVIEADTDARTEPIYAPLNDTARAGFRDALRRLPS